jgi:acyl-CoA thioester hydrolase
MESILNITPRYQETDQMGVIHHSVYAIWFEMGRVEYCNNIGLPFHVIEDKGLRLAMIDLRSKFIKPAIFGQNYILKTYLTELTKVKLIFKYLIFNQNQELIHEGESTLVWLDQSLRPINVSKNYNDVYQIFLKEVKKPS